MIYILAGIAKSGKSIIANEILINYHIHVISTDWIMMMLHHGNKNLNIDVNKSDITVSHLLEPYLEGLIASLVQSRKDILIEGVHIQPEFADRLMTKFPNRIKCVFLGYKEIDPKLKSNQLRVHAAMIDNPWYMHMNDSEILELTLYLKLESEKLFDACLKYNKTYIEVRDITIDKKYIIGSLFKE